MTERPPYPHVYAIDFDDTIAQANYNNGRWLMGELMEGMKEAVNEVSRDNQIIIFTARPKKEWGQVTQYLAEHGVVFDGIMEKPLGIAYVDDRAMLPHEFVDKFKPRERKPIDLDEYYASEQDPYPLREDEDGNPF